MRCHVVRAFECSTSGWAPTESICRPDDGRLMYRRTGAPLDLFFPRASACRSSSRLVLLNFVFSPESFLRHESLSRFRFASTAQKRGKRFRCAALYVNARKSGCCVSSRSRIKGIHVSKSSRLLPAVRFYYCYPSYLIIARYHQSAVSIS